MSQESSKPRKHIRWFPILYTVYSISLFSDVCTTVDDWDSDTFLLQGFCTTPRCGNAAVEGEPETRPSDKILPSSEVRKNK